MKQYRIVLASNSPRRRQLMGGLDIPFEVRVLPDIEENYPKGLSVNQIPEYIATEKAEAYRAQMAGDELIITADTVVILGQEVLGKPSDSDDACRMLRELSGRTHQVITGVCLTTKERQKSFSVTTDVTFGPLTEEEITHYVKKYQPFDKAGAYGIQEWIGYIGVTGLKGSYYNVMGLPIQRIYTELKAFSDSSDE
ncbi:MAG: septum formation protein Maf [Prevotella sp.]|nr:septum formation protein Maf [Prevotella sp.]